MAGFPLIRSRVRRLETLALALLAGAGLCGTAHAEIMPFPQIKVWAIPGAYQDSSLVRPSRCVGDFVAPMADSLVQRSRTVTVRFTRDRRAEARRDFGGYRVYRISVVPDSGRAVLIGARRAQLELDQLLAAGLISRREHAERRAAFQRDIIDAERTLRVAGMRSHEDVVQPAVLLAQKAAILDAARRGLITERTAAGKRTFRRLKVPKTIPRTPRNFPACSSCVSIRSTAYGASSVSSRNKIVPFVSISHGVPRVETTSERQPPTRRPTARPPCKASRAISFWRSKKRRSVKARRRRETFLGSFR